MVVGAGQSGLNISEIANLRGFLPTEPSLGFTENDPKKRGNSQ